MGSRFKLPALALLGALVFFGCRDERTRGDTTHATAVGKPRREPSYLRPSNVRPGAEKLSPSTDVGHADQMTPGVDNLQAKDPKQPELDLSKPAEPRNDQERGIGGAGKPEAKPDGVR